MDVIDAVRRTLPKCWFEPPSTDNGLNALDCYHKDWDEKTKEYKDRPVHDWSADDADAFGILALASQQENLTNANKQTKIIGMKDYKVFSERR